MVFTSGGCTEDTTGFADHQNMLYMSYSLNSLKGGLDRELYRGLL